MSEYPNLWKRGLIQHLIRARANHQCEECGMRFKLNTNLAESATNRKGKAIVGTVHHIDHNKANCAMNNLVFLCQKCHYLAHLLNWIPGKPLPPRWAANPPKWLVTRGYAQESDQLGLL